MANLQNLLRRFNSVCVSVENSSPTCGPGPAHLQGSLCATHQAGVLLHAETTGRNKQALALHTYQSFPFSRRCPCVSFLFFFLSWMETKSMCSLINHCITISCMCVSTVCARGCVHRPRRYLLTASRWRTMLTGFINEPRTWSSSSGIRCWELQVAKRKKKSTIYCPHFLPSHIK